MSDYTQITDFSAKDALASGNPLKLIRGSDVDAELDAISVAIATKFDLPADVDHDATTNFVADEHVAHSGVDITAGSGLTGGGNISATRTLNVGAGVGIAVNADDVALDIAGLTVATPADGDSLAIHDATAAAPREATLAALANLFAGLGLSAASSVMALDINGLTTENSVDGASDTIAFYDNSAGTIRKTSVNNIGGGGGGGFTAVKASDETISNDSTPTLDSDLDISGLNSSATYAVEIGLLWNQAGAGPDGLEFQSNYTHSPASDFIANASYLDGGSTVALTRIAGNTVTALPDSQTSVTKLIVIRGILQGATSFGVRWAQNVSDASNTTLEQGSYIHLTQVS